ncbi:hypothetical protein K1719_045897 [Acacia pycnantha]|nr:hypothetical protein K1719_045897 [Acacia pycnantha]
MKRRKSKEASSSETPGEHLQADVETLQREASPTICNEAEVAASSQIKKRKNKVLEGNYGIPLEEKEINAMKETNSHYSGEKTDVRKNKMKKRLLKEAENADKRGVCYLSRIPPHMDPLKLRRILSQYGDIQRIYLAPEGDSASRAPSKSLRRSRDLVFSEGWVEFTDKRVAKRVANMLNGEQIGGKKRSAFYYDLWNIKYLSKFKWDDLTEELAFKKAVREQKLTVELSAAKRERDFYLSKVDQSRALSSIEERLKKKRKPEQDSGKIAKVIRHFPQKKPISANADGNKPKLSDDLLDAVFGGL